MPADKIEVFDGGCACGTVRYRMNARPMFVHCCHCLSCQRETGSAFALNALIEADRVLLLSGTPETVATPSDSGKGQDIVRCPDCRIALWSHYAAARKAVSFLRVGTLDAPDRIPPDIHIYTRSKQPWVALPDNIPTFEAFYSRRKVWSQESLERYAAAVG